MTVTASKKKPATRTRKGRVTDQHKKAMADGRQQSLHVRRYLDALKVATAPKTRGRKRTPETIQTRIDKINFTIAEGDLEPLNEVKAIQERIDLQRALDELNVAAPDPAEFEGDFVKAVKPYSERHGITYQAWRELGVPAIVLRKAKVPR